MRARFVVLKRWMSEPSVKHMSESEEDRAFLQRRVALFGLIMGIGYSVHLVYRSVMMITFGYTSQFADPSFGWHMAAAISFLGLWLVNARGRRSTRFVRTSELVGLMCGVFSTGVMASYIRFADRPDFIMLLALCNVIIARAVFVPSSGRWTLTIGIVVGALVVGRVYFGALGINLDEWIDLHPEIEGRTISQVAGTIAIETSVWWALAVMTSVLASVVIYGLRQQIREAEQLGQYRLEEKLGEGGMGVVYRASHALLRRPTAVKLLPPDRAGVENVRRFEQEVQMTAGLTHPHTITIFDYGHTSDGVFYYAMELVDGLSLTEVVARSGPQPPGRVVELMGQAASALVEAHGIGLVHRDIKPANIMVQLLHPHRGAGDFVKVLDFGLVKEIRQEGGIDLTNEANIAGTPQYMAPESILRPEAVDARADVYALGAVAYYLLTGTHVFGGRSIVEVSSHHLHTQPEPPSERAQQPIPPDLEALVLRCLAKDPNDRPQSAFALECALSECQGIEPWTPDQAQQWWHDNGQPVSLTKPSGVERTLAIDWAVTSRGGPDRA